MSERQISSIADPKKKYKQLIDYGHYLDHKLETILTIYSI